MTEIAKLKLRIRSRTAGAEAKGRQAARRARHGRGGCRCLCDHLTGLQVGVECDSLCEIDRCTRVDLHNGVALACVKLGQDECGGWRFASRLRCLRTASAGETQRPAVRPHQWLRRHADHRYRLENWHRSPTSVPFNDFSEAFGPKAYDQDEYVTRDFWVRFSRPVRVDTLQPDAFIMTVYGLDRGRMVDAASRAGRSHSSHPQPDDPPGHARVATIVVDGAWLEDAVRGRANLFRMSEAQVEIEVRGDFIVDCNDQTIDANAHGRVAVPTGSDGPGRQLPFDLHGRKIGPQTEELWTG